MTKALLPVGIALMACSGSTGSDRDMRADMGRLDLPRTMDVRRDQESVDLAQDGARDSRPRHTPCEQAPGRGSVSGTIHDDTGEARVLASGEVCRRRFELSSTAARRDNLPVSPRVFEERTTGPAVSSRNLMFDALYALALEEAAENSVSSIKDGAFDHGAALSCPPGGCFETGRKWGYVWTRDIAYATYLGLALLDPIRSRNSLAFKTSPLRNGGGRQLVQDTGTGGSYPISSDRVVWAMGAREVLRTLDDKDRQAFARLCYEALTHTIEQDRALVFDSADGLYRGEQSFLDWREQSYPAWVKDDPVHIGMSRALSTNVGHLTALAFAADLAHQAGDLAVRDRYRGWAVDLSAAIRQRFYLVDAKQFSAFVPTELDPRPNRQWDLLGLSLAVLHNVASPQQAKEAISNYPLLPMGPPVLWPQQAAVPIYHNRAIWPFVTALFIRAAKKTRNDRAVTLGIASLMRGAGLNLSNMENLELVSGRPYLEDGSSSGPVVNSQRQLWSVAGYLSMVHQVIFGLELTDAGFVIDPYIPRALRHQMFGAADALMLHGLPYRGKVLDLVVRLPPKQKVPGDGAYHVATIRLDGRNIVQREILHSELRPRSVVEVLLTDAPEQASAIRLLNASAGHQELFAPRIPAIASLALVNGKIELSLDMAGEEPASLEIHVYRDGVAVASKLSGHTTTWRDPDSSATSRSHCYVIETRFKSSGNASQHSAPSCFWGAGQQRVHSISARDLQNTGGEGVDNHGRFHFQNWGDPGHQLVLRNYLPSFTGDHLLQVVAGNGSGPIHTGITCAVKLLEVFEEQTSVRIASGQLMMPQLGDWQSWRDSSFVRAKLDKTKRYRIVIRQDANSLNMSDLSHFARYTGGQGGLSGPYHRVNISALKILSLSSN